MWGAAELFRVFLWGVFCLTMKTTFSEEESSAESFETFLQWKRQRFIAARDTGARDEAGGTRPVGSVPQTAGARAAQLEPVKAAPRAPQASVPVAQEPEKSSATPPPPLATVQHVQPSPAPVLVETPAPVAAPAALPAAAAVGEPAAVGSVAVDERASLERTAQQPPAAAQQPISNLKDDTSEDSENAAPTRGGNDNNAPAATKDKEEAAGKVHLPGQAADGAWATGPMDSEAEAALAAAPFDSKAWLGAFRQAKRDGDEARSAFLRRVVQRGTDEVLRNKAYEKEGKTVKLGDTSESVKRTAFYDGKSAFGSFARSHQTTAHFVKADAVDVALFMLDKKNVNPVVLVMADETVPGGRGDHGSCAQEESIYRRTTLKLNLEDPDGADRDREWKWGAPALGVSLLL